MGDARLEVVLQAGQRRRQGRAIGRHDVVAQQAGAGAHAPARCCSLAIACVWPVYVADLGRATDSGGLRPDYSANLLVQLEAATDLLDRRWYERTTFASPKRSVPNAAATKKPRVEAAGYPKRHKSRI
jgi:hypothetical protein